MDLSQIKMVVTDMDGTLLNSKHEVSSRFFEIYEELKKKNIAFVAASGRQYHSMVDKLDSIKNEILVIAENGALIRKQEKTLLTTTINQSEVHRILDTVRPLENVHPVLCSQNTAYVGGDSNEFLDMLREYYSEFQIVEDQKQVVDDVLKIAIYHFENSEEHIYPHVKHLEGDLKVKVSGTNWVDISDLNAHKGYALKKVMDEFQIASNEIMVFGDYNNDLEMLELSDFSFAMANAHPNVLKMAKFRTDSNDNFGVERILEKLL
ncbi:MAG TPA: Cof-type HAD-IIB family hydrolase [Muricauda sp.]|uniref:HAD family hydrolase n=1 Tax=Flagellimonas aurea TaxID=2915619 RepID=A0ABS3G5E2_9FLAO|nr:HAD family hydrolase [Allomuricauda aurea]MBO0354621.1 HAD family hydrolase [Allomuricauda aurea]HBU76759.1 Cof-type HAD-IIB family hydrolase [Allomuricauda sp.]|tara:strand:+ start:775 stop:1566 length:792 start_codon:yes stop_codon:yes gene_type:complete